MLSLLERRLFERFKFTTVDVLAHVMYIQVREFRHSLVSGARCGDLERPSNLVSLAKA